MKMRWKLLRIISNIYDENAMEIVTKCYVLVWQGVENKNVLHKMSIWWKHDEHCHKTCHISDKNVSYLWRKCDKNCDKM